MDLDMASPGTANDPYAAPRAALVAGTTRPGAALDALLLGFLVAFVGMSIGSCALRLATLLELVQSRFDHLQLALAMRLAIQLVAVASAFAGGYCCARVARSRELALGAVLGAISISVGVLANVADDGALRDTLFLASAFAATVLGAWAGRVHNGYGAVPTSGDSPDSPLREFHDPRRRNRS